MPLLRESDEVVSRFGSAGGLASATHRHFFHVLDAVSGFLEKDPAQRRKLYDAMGLRIDWTPGADAANVQLNLTGSPGGAGERVGGGT